MKGVTGPGLSPSARSPCSSSRSDMAGTGRHQQEGTGFLTPVELSSSSVSQRAAMSLSRDDWSSGRKWKSEGPGGGSRGGLWAGLASGWYVREVEACGKDRVRDCRWAFSSATLPAMMSPCTSCGVPGDFGTLWDGRTLGRSRCLVWGNDPAQGEVWGTESSAPEASTAVTKEASEL